jgi:hypothetical protein
MFITFPKIARLSRECVITEKLDGTNAQIYIEDDETFHVGSRNRWLTPDNDNFGFCKWATENKEELLKLGPGRHYGEWWGSGIQRGYGLKEKRFSLFNTKRWGLERPSCCHVVPVLYRGVFDTDIAEVILENLHVHGSVAAPGFNDPEGIIVFHSAASINFKKTIKDDMGKREK